MKFQHILHNVAEAVPTYRRDIFKTIVVGLLIGKDGSSIAAIFREFAGLFAGTVITRKRFYMFVNAKAIKWSAIWTRVADLLRRHVLVNGRLLIALDDTTYGKSGRHIDGCDTHFDHSSKLNTSAWIFGHCRVVAGLLTKCHGRWACLPMAQKNFVRRKQSGRKEKIHAGLQKKTIRSRKRKRSEQWQKTKSGIAAELVKKISEFFKFPVLVVCDSWFGTYTVLKGMRNNADPCMIHMLSRLRVSCVLHQLPEQQAGRGKRGRPRTYGERLPSVQQLAAQMRPQAVTGNIHIYGKQRQCTYSELTCVSKALKCMVKVVFVHRSNGRFFPLISTDLTLTAAQMIEYYSARWKIESGFKELKHELGALDSQCRNETAVENHFNLCCLAMTLAWTYGMKRANAPNRRHPAKRSSSFAFADIRRTIATELRGEPIIPKGCPEILKRAVKLVRDNLFGIAA